MKLRSTKYFIVVTLSYLVLATTSYADIPAQMKMTTPIAPGVMVPDKVETSIGSLNLHYGYPDDATTQKNL